MAFVVICAAYLGAAARVLHGDALRIRDTFSFPDNPAQRRLTYVLLTLVVPWALLLVETSVEIFVDLPLALKVVLGLTRLVCLVALCAYALQPRGLMLTAKETSQVPPGPAKYARSTLGDSDRRRIAEKLRRVIEEERIYRDPFLTLRKLMMWFSTGMG